MHKFISHLQKASELHVKRKLALHTYRTKRVTEARAKIKENRELAAGASQWLTKKHGGITKEQREEARRRSLVISHSSFLQKREGMGTLKVICGVAKFEVRVQRVLSKRHTVV